MLSLTDSIMNMYYKQFINKRNVLFDRITGGYDGAQLECSLLDGKLANKLFGAFDFEHIAFFLIITLNCKHRRRQLFGIDKFNRLVWFSSPTISFDG